MKHAQAQIKDTMAGIEGKQNEIKISEMIFKFLQCNLYFYFQCTLREIIR